ncbi:MAG: ATP-dependent DNA helicase RecG [Pelagibacteraceae bacterium]|jgi:ATP-dependent DNA helicase RecG|nr:ATP-dependent DNA helicase RecG [Pelagibacteraceae bacterium]MBT6197984.1 ATP-dependent DNA helicase RecG [Pelagibacteraceae bacterium]
MRPAHLDLLLSPINKLKGVGPKLENIINKLGINLNVHFLWHFPYRIIEKKYYENIHDAPINQLVTIKIEVIKHYPSKFRRQPYRVSCLANEIPIDIVYFNARHPVIRSVLPLKSFKMISGKLQFFKNKFQITHPASVENISHIQLLREKEPVYSLTAGLNMKSFIKLSNQVLQLLPNPREWIDNRLLKKYNFVSWKEAIEKLHNPEIEDTYNEKNFFRRRLAFDELYAHQLAICIIRTIDNKKKSTSFKNKNKLKKILINSLEFKLTNSQSIVLNEIQNDLESNKQMIRLLQGDVGSGKTIVALISMLTVIESGYQATLMAPTSILAYQHFENISKLLQNLPIQIDILTGKDKGKSRIEKLEKIKDGSTQIIIGTHALIQEGVNFKKLGFSVIDEQHRFGVYQRMAFNYKGFRPSILVMSATPIPRTLTLAAYGDMDESRLIDKPIGRKPIKTSSLTLKKEKNLIERIKAKINNSNDKFFWVCPLIEESQELDLKAATDRYNSLNKIFKNKVMLIHGELSEKEKESTMEKFKNEDYRILVATTVIEVGIDIKSATTIIIEHAERFGLAQLHQLRGRVGRNNEESYCILLHKENLNDTAKKRISIMIETNDGFLIAEEDLKIRGPGEILGKRQSGLPSFNVADLSYDGDLLEEAKFYADNIITEDPRLERNGNKNLKDLLYIQERDTAIRTLSAG